MGWITIGAGKRHPPVAQKQSTGLLSNFSKEVTKTLTRAELVLDTKTGDFGALPNGRTNIRACTQDGEEE